MTDLGSILITGAIIFTGTVVVGCAAFFIGTAIGKALIKAREPAIDYEAMQPELDEAFAPARKTERA